MIYLRNPLPKALHAWSALLIVILLAMQFLGHQHRVAHALSQNGVFLVEASQELSQISSDDNDFFQFLHSPFPEFFSSYHSRAPPALN